MKSFSHYFIATLIILTASWKSNAQQIPHTQLISIDSLSTYLKPEIKAELEKEGPLTQAMLAQYFREQFSKRYFFDWKTVDGRMKQYNDLYGNQTKHASRADDHMSKFADATTWKLPFNYLNGKSVNAYALRHLARQHKMVDVAFLYFNDNKDPKYIEYFTDQMKSLNVALTAGEYEKREDGNGVYEAFRSGYRILNWLEVHNLFLGEPTYDDESQLTTIVTLLQHASHMYEKNDAFHAGNHQTRGVSALAMISILLRDFLDADLWNQRAMTRLNEHLSKEINPDGFQFERTVHYHMSDIGNFYYPYQLAKISNIDIDPVWESKLKSLFTSLVKIAYPDKSAPVLQDDTEITWAEKNDISGALTLGYLLFEDPEFGYFSNPKVDGKMYWFLNQSQLGLLNNIEKKKPNYGSLSFPDTKYYVMREGWDKGDNMMIISAGVDPDKPDHQHGDILGIQGIANGHIILPNYQVKYPYKDLELFKNSMVKNVALVDHELQGKKWTSNQGGSGFGKFKSLPNPTTIVWESNEEHDLFIGSHDGFENVDVRYARTVINVNNNFWVVKDDFESGYNHTFKQIWQGHYTEEKNGLLRASFDDASGCDIYQLNETKAVDFGGTRGKEWAIVQTDSVNNYAFLTIIYPYKGAGNRIDETNPDPKVGDWKVNNSEWAVGGENSTSLSKKTAHYFFDVTSVSLEGITIESQTKTDLFIKLKEGKITIQSLSQDDTQLKIKGVKITTKGYKSKNAVLKPGESLVGTK
ncbi:MAG: heparinase II/III family protein [Reichenbachiella sp.]